MLFEKCSHLQKFGKTLILNQTALALYRVNFKTYDVSIKLNFHFCVLDGQHNKSTCARTRPPPEQKRVRTDWCACRLWLAIDSTRKATTCIEKNGTSSHFWRFWRITHLANVRPHSTSPWAENTVHRWFHMPILTCGRVNQKSDHRN